MGKKITPEKSAFRKQLGELMAGAGINTMKDIQGLFQEMIGSSETPRNSSPTRTSRSSWQT